MLIQNAFTTHTEATTHAWAVQDHQLRVFSLEYGWSPTMDLESTAGTQMDIATGNQPTASRDALARRYAPVPEHQQATLTPVTAERFGSMPPLQPSTSGPPGCSPRGPHPRPGSPTNRPR